MFNVIHVRYWHTIHHYIMHTYVSYYTQYINTAEVQSCEKNQKGKAFHFTIYHFPTLSLYIIVWMYTLMFYYRTCYCFWLNHQSILKMNGFIKSWIHIHIHLVECANISNDKTLLSSKCCTRVIHIIMHTVRKKFSEICIVCKEKVVHWCVCVYNNKSQVR